MLILTLLNWYLTKLKRNKKVWVFLFKFFSKNLVETKNSIFEKIFETDRYNEQIGVLSPKPSFFGN